MGRALRAAEAGYVYHVLNRANARMTIFEKDQDHEAFEQVLTEAVGRTKLPPTAWAQTTAMRPVAAINFHCFPATHWHVA